MPEKKSQHSIQSSNIHNRKGSEHSHDEECNSTNESNFEIFVHYEQQDTGRKCQVKVYGNVPADNQTLKTYDLCTLFSISKS